MADAPVVGIVGLAALRRDIKRLTDDPKSPLYDAIKRAGKMAVEPVAARTRALLPHSDRKDHASRGRLVASVRTSGTRTGGAVRMGTKAISWAGWIDFGGVRKTPHEATREYIATGRYLYPSAQSLAPVSASLYSAALAGVFAQDGVWTNVTTDGSAVHD